MRALTTISVLLNLGFIALVIVLLSSSDKPGASSAGSLVIAPELDSKQAVTPAAARSEADSQSESFHWSQIESTDSRLAAETVPIPAAVDSSPLPARPGRPKPEPVDPSMPLVFQPADPTMLKLSEEQLQAVDRLQQWFIDQVGGVGQDPNDPGYRKRWLKAQSQMNEMTRGMLGVSVFEAYQLAAQSGQQ